MLWNKSLKLSGACKDKYSSLSQICPLIDLAKVSWGKLGNSILWSGKTETDPRVSQPSCTSESPRHVFLHCECQECRPKSNHAPGPVLFINGPLTKASHVAQSKAARKRSISAQRGEGQERSFDNQVHHSCIPSIHELNQFHQHHPLLNELPS